MTGPAQAARDLLQFPEEVTAVQRAALLRPLHHSAWRQPTRAGIRERRFLTRDQPLYFAITYLSHWLRNQETEVYSLSLMHMHLASRARRWTEPGVAIREATIAPRKAAKSVWLFIILPLWALAHGHRRFLMAFSSTDPVAAAQLADLRSELESNELLLQDFPEMALRRGRKSAMRAVTESGATVAARGMGASTRGARSGTDRPDLLVGDDMESDESKYGPAEKEKVLSAIRQVILPMNHRAVVQLTGTVTAAGSVAHDLARAGQGRATAPWITETGFTCKYWAPILGEGTDRERSLWEQQWTLAELKAMRGTRTYAMEMANDPDQAEAVGYWSRDLIHRDARIECVRRLLYVDPACSSKTGGRGKTDETAIVLLGVDRFGRKAVVEAAWAGRYPGYELKNLIFELHEIYPETLREVFVEVNQGGERWDTDSLEVLPIPNMLKLDRPPRGSSKAARIERAIEHYQRGAVWHAKELRKLEDQMLSWTPKRNGPGVDDLVDALAGALRQVFPGKVRAA